MAKHFFQAVVNCKARDRALSSCNIRGEFLKCFAMTGQKFWGYIFSKLYLWSHIWVCHIFPHILRKYPHILVLHVFTNILWSVCIIQSSSYITAFISYKAITIWVLSEKYFSYKIIKFMTIRIITPPNTTFSIALLTQRGFFLLLLFFDVVEFMKIDRLLLIVLT